MLKRVLIGLGVLVALLIVVVIVAPFFIPAGAYKGRIESAVQDATGRPLKIRGALRFSLLPTTGIQANDVHFGNAPGAKNAEMATLKQLVLEVRLLPLLHGNVEIARFVLVDPDVNLEVDKSGRGNWVFAKPGGTAASAAPKGAAPPAKTSSGNVLGGREIRLGEVRLENGKINYRDDRSGKSYVVNKIGMTVSLPDMESPFALNGQFDWNGQTVKLGAKGRALGKIMAGAGSPLGLSVSSQPINLSFDGKLGTLQPLALDGGVKLNVPSVRKLAAWVGSPLQGDQGFGPLSIEGKLALAGKRISFTDAAVALDDMKGKGEVSLDTGGAKPVITAKLDLDHLNLNNYTAKTAKEGAAAGGGNAPAQKSAKGKAASDWSDAPIDVSPLKSLDANLALSVGAIQVQEIKIGKSQLEAKLKDGLLTANLPEMNLYDGKGHGSISVDGRGAAPAFKASFNLADVQAEPLLKDAAGIGWLLGKANLDFDGTATGKSQRALVSALNGKGKMAFRDGAIKGINIAAMVRNVETAFLDSAAGKAQQTDFSSLTGSYTITNGTLSNKDLEMVSPLFRLTGSGTSDLPKRTVNYKLTPKVVASTQGQGGKFSKAGIAVPILITGRWDDIHYGPDLSGAATKELQQKLKGLVPGQSDQGGSSGGTTQKPGDVLKNLFGK